jgi:hypothetical protein
MDTRLGPGDRWDEGSVDEFVDSASVHARKGDGLLKRSSKRCIEVAGLYMNELCGQVRINATPAGSAEMFFSDAGDFPEAQRHDTATSEA